MAGSRSLLWLLVPFAALAWLLRPSKAEAAPTPQPAPKPAPKGLPVAPKPVPTPSPSEAPTDKSYRSLPGDIVEKYPRLQLKSGKGFTIVPLWDKQNNTWARTTYEGGEAPLAALGLRYPTPEELDEIAKRPDTLVLNPVTLVNTAADSANMGTKAFWDRHDLQVQAQLDAAGWDGKTPVTSIGKHWAIKAGQDSQHSGLHGWYVPPGNPPRATKGEGFTKIIQNRGHSQHGRNHIDYSSTLIGVEV